jgi:hypothetical protein
MDSRAKKYKIFITEVLNDLHRNGFAIGGKAECMLSDWAKELREECRDILPPSKLKKVFCDEVGKENW